MKIDIFAHIVPPKYLEALLKTPLTVPSRIDRTKAIRTLYDVDQRLRIIESFGDVVQVLTVTGFPIDTLVNPADAVELARIANDNLAEIIAQHPDRFVAGVACLPMTDIEATLQETDRAIKDLNFKGVQLYTEIGGEPLDREKFRPLYEKLVSYNLPLWLHPNRSPGIPDYAGESRSKYLACHVFTWPYQTALAMNRLVYGGIMEDFPDLKVITHHCGGIVPYLADRIPEFYDCDIALQKGEAFPRKLKKPAIEYFKRFYADTVTCGSVPALTCGYAFFGADHIVFATDMPYDAELGARQTRESIRAVEQMTISVEERQKIFEGNARHLLNIQGVQR